MTAYTLTQEDVSLLRRMFARMGHSNMTNLVYIPPAQALRNRADEMEKEEADYILFKNLIAQI